MFHNIFAYCTLVDEKFEILRLNSLQCDELSVNFVGLTLGNKSEIHWVFSKARPRKFVLTPTTPSFLRDLSMEPPMLKLMF